VSQFSGSKDGSVVEVEEERGHPLGLGGGRGEVATTTLNWQQPSSSEETAEAVSGTDLASTEVKLDCDRNGDHDWNWVGVMMMSALTLDHMSSQSTGSSCTAAITESTSLASLPPPPPDGTTAAAPLARAVSEPAALLSSAHVASNAIDYHCPRTFAEGSELHHYLAKKLPKRVTLSHRVYSLHQVLVSLRDVMKEADLFDRKNPCVVVCDQELEKALDVKAVHLSQMRDYVLKQMTKGSAMVNGVWQQLMPHDLPIGVSGGGGGVASDAMNRESDVVTSSTTSSGCENGAAAIFKLSSPRENGKGKGVESGGAKNGSPKGIAVDTNGSYRVRRPFRKVLRNLPGVEKDKSVFSYKELVGHLSQYILVNKDRLFDSRNSMVVLCQDDLLGKAFGLRAFHRSQVTSLLRKQLLSKEKVKKMDKLTHENSNRGKARKRPQEEVADEPDSSTSPTSQNGEAAGKSGKSGNGSSSKSKRQKRRRKSRSFSLTLELSDGEEEDIEVVEYHDTDEDEGREESDDDDTTTDSDDSDLTFNTEQKSSDGEGADFQIENVYRLEYEVSSDSEGEDESKKRNGEGGKRAGGGGNSDSNDSDSDLGEAIIVASVLLDNDTDLAQWADSSSESDQEQTFEFELSNYDAESGCETWKCVNCGQPNVPYIRYCHRCWQERKGWVPERPKPKRGKRKEKRTGGVAVKNTAKGNSSSTSMRKTALKRSLSADHHSEGAGPAAAAAERAKGDGGGVQVKEVRSTSVSEDEDADLMDERVTRTHSSESLGSQDSGLGGMGEGTSSSQEEALAANSPGLLTGGALLSGTESDDSRETNKPDAAEAEALEAAAASAHQGSGQNRALRALLCTFCCVRPKDACFVHGKISHQVCCYPCAKKLYKQKGTCPVCRRRIEKITKNIMV